MVVVIMPKNKIKNTKKNVFLILPMPKGRGFLLIGDIYYTSIVGVSHPGIKNYYGRVNIPVVNRPTSRTFPIPYRKPVPTFWSG